MIKIICFILYSRHKNNVLKGLNRRKAVRSSLKPYEPKHVYAKPRREKTFNNYIIILIIIRLLNKQNNSYFKY